MGMISAARCIRVQIALIAKFGVLPCAMVEPTILVVHIAHASRFRVMPNLVRELSPVGKRIVAFAVAGLALFVTALLIFSGNW